MIYQGKSLSVDYLQPGIAELRFDLSGESVNKFNRLTLGELADALTALEQADDVKGLVITSGKKVFIAGADISEFGAMFSLSDEDFAAELGRTNALFNRIEDLKVPTVVAINGAAVGGGFELCLAADYRVASSQARVGLPEVTLGIQPGWGGSVRLPRLIGCDNALEWIASGKHQRPDVALSVGAVDAVVAPEKLVDAAVDLVQQCIDGSFDYQARRREKCSPVKLNDTERMMVFTTGKGRIAAQAGPNVPAPLAAANSIEESAGMERAAALEVETRSFIELARTPQAEALIGVFMNDQAVAKQNKQFSRAGNDVNRAGVLGAGIMGGGIAYQAALKGSTVLMKDIAEEGLALGLEEAKKLLSKEVSRGRIDAATMGDVLNRIRATLSYDGFDEVDLVVEAVVENPKVKKAVLAECESKLRDDAVLTSNTSTISIDELAAACQRPQQFCGMHFFNPVHRMPLVEVIRGAQTSAETVGTVVAYAKALGKTPIVVNDCPGFYVNRVLFPYFAGFNLLLRDGADYKVVDKVMQRFGWPMGPAYLLDVVGIDTAKHCDDVLAEGFPDRMRYPGESATTVMYNHERYGQKNGLGFYRYEQDPKGRPQKLPDEAAEKLVAGLQQRQAEFSEEEIIARLMIPMCNEVARCVEEDIVASPAEADMGLILGLGFPAFRGGPLRYIQQLGIDHYCQQADQYRELSPLYEVPALLRDMAAEGKRFFS